jgi:hypothetical protein
MKSVGYRAEFVPEHNVGDPVLYERTNKVGRVKSKKMMSNRAHYLVAFPDGSSVSCFGGELDWIRHGKVVA